MTTTELLSAGFSTAQIRTKISRGELVELVKSVTATSRGALALRAAATLAPLGPRAVASHHTAAQLFGLDLLGRVPASVAITLVPGTGSRKSWPDVRVHHAAKSIARVAFRDCGLPPPQLQVLLGADGHVIARVDFYWERFRTIAEADGEMKYDNRFAATHQLRRDADLRDAGFEVVHFGWRDICDTPAQVAESIRAAFRRGSRSRPATADAS